MRYIDRSKEEEKKVTAEVGDFIFADGHLRVIYKGLDSEGDVGYLAIYVTGRSAFKGAGKTEDSIEKLVEWYKSRFSDFELIKSDEMKLVREA